MTSVESSYPYLTRFERAKILSERAEQLANGAPPLTPNIDSRDEPLMIAMKELVENNIPFKVRRIHSDGVSYEDIHISRLVTDPTGEISALIHESKQGV